MKERILYICLLIGLSYWSVAQTSSITSVSTTTAAICPGNALAVTFTTSGTYAAGTTFTAYLSNATGSISPGTIIGSLSRPTASSGTVTSTINTTIPASTGAGTGYRIGVAVGTGVKTISSNTVTISRPAAPIVTNPAPYCEGETAQSLLPNATASKGGVLKWYALNGTPSSTPTIPNTNLLGDTDYLVSQVVDGCESPTATIIVTVKKALAAPGTSPLAYCVGQTASSLTATPVSGALLNWYTVATGGTPSPRAPIPSTTTPGSTSYHVSQTLNGCEGPRATLVVTVYAYPNPPAIKTPPATCQGSTPTPFGATPDANGKLFWWNSPDKQGTSSPTANLSTTESKTYYVSQEVNGCNGNTAAISVTIIASPTEPATKAPTPVCSGATVGSLTATATSADYELRWWGTNAQGGSSTTEPPKVSNTKSDTYYVSQVTKVGSCPGPRKGISVTINPLPDKPTFPTPDIYCQGRESGKLQANPSSGAVLNWYGTIDKDRGGAPSPEAPSPPTDVVRPAILYYVSQSYKATGCESAERAVISVTVNPIPALPTVTAAGPYCAGQSVNPLQATGTNLKWYGTNQTGGSPSGNAPTPSTASSAIGTNTYYLTQTVNGCESERAGIPIRIKTTPDKPTVQNASFCQFYPATTLAATAIPNATLNWYGESPSGGTRTDNPPTVPNTIDKTYTYYVSQTLDGCESGLGSSSGRAQLTVRVKPTPLSPGVSPIALCNNEQASPLQATGTNLKWYTNQDSPIQGTPTPNTGSVGQQIYKVTQTSNEGCESTQKASLIVTIKPLPAPPTVQSVNYCQIQQDQPPQNVVSLATNAQGQNLRWFDAGGREISVPTPSIERAGLQTYEVSQTVDGCQGGRSTIQVAVNTMPAPTTPKPLTTYCIDDKAVPFQASGAAGSQLKWIDPYGRIWDAAPTPSTINTNIDPQGDAYFVYQIGTNGCYSPRATLRVIVTSPPTLALIAPVSSVNLGIKAPLQLKFTSTGPYSYSITGGYTGTSRTADTTISVLPRGNTIYQVEAVSNGCGVGLPGNPATAQVTVRVPTVSTSTLASTTLCAGTNLTVPFTTSGQFNAGNAFRIELISLTDTTQKYAVQTVASGSPVTAPLPVTLNAGQYYVRVRADNPEIPIIGSNSPSLLTVRTTPSATLTGTQTIYAGVPASLTFTFGGSAPWSVLYADSLTTYSATVTSSPYIIDARPTRTTIYQLLGVSNECGSGPVSGTAAITVAPLLGVEDNPLDPLVKTYPVPTQTILRVDLDLPLVRNPAILSLTDASGKPVFQHTTRSQQNALDLTQPAQWPVSAAYTGW